MRLLEILTCKTTVVKVVAPLYLPAPLYLRTLWRYTNAVIVIIISLLKIFNFLMLQVTKRRLWKLVYDQMDGCSEKAGAATAVRRNYEKLVVFISSLNLQLID